MATNNSGLTCPITLERLVDPVLATDGHTYEKKAITEWLTTHGTSPQTRQPMRIQDLIPNRALRDILDSQNGTVNATNTDSAAEAAAAVAAASSYVENKIERQSTIPLDCSGEIVKKIKETKASIRKSSVKASESIVHIETPDIQDVCASSHICCVIDVSGSMGSQAECKDENGRENRTGLSILDVVKFATKVISKSLQPNDLLSIVTYSDSAKVVLSPQHMTDEGMARVEQVLEGIREGGLTNLWDGMKKSIEISNGVGNKYINSIFVLTDGIPNIDPPLGYTRSLTNLLNKKPVFGSISTFGFGYNLESELLVDIAKLGAGYFSFIPDAGFVGTCFINAIANCRCAFGVKPKIRISKRAGAAESVTPADEVFSISKNSEDTCLNISSLRSAAAMDFVINTDFIEGAEAFLEFDIVGGETVRVPVTKPGWLNLQHPEAKTDLFHSTKIKFIKDASAIRDFDAGQVDALKPPQAVMDARKNDALLDGLCKDMEGQASEAISTEDYYDRWGDKYILSLIEAHLHQFCNNFKDPGIQAYGQGELFMKLQDDLNDIFEEIPPPQPSQRPGYSRSYSSRSSSSSAPKSAAPPVAMANVYNNRNAVCVHGDTEVTTIIGDEHVKIPICQLKKGDSVLLEDNTFAKIECIVQTVCDEQLPLIQIGELLVTAYHPIKTDQGWEFPVNCSGAIHVTNSGAYSVFNMILENGNRSKGVMMNGVSCITLGHGVKDDAVLYHEYFGTDRVVEDVMKIKAAVDVGHVVLREEDVKRINDTGDIFAIEKVITNTQVVRSSDIICSV